MKCFALAILAIVIGKASAQTLVEKPFIMRYNEVTVDAFSHITGICVIVFPDGRYRMERTFQSSQQGHFDDWQLRETKVFTGTLLPDDLKNLQAALDNDDLQRIKTAAFSVELPNLPIDYRLSYGRLGSIGPTLSLSIPREHDIQNIEFGSPAQRKPYDKALKPFFNSLKALDKRKIPAAKNEIPHNCEAPRRSTSRAGSSPEPDPQHP
jgi:hypothetical protein